MLYLLRRQLKNRPLGGYFIEPTGLLGEQKTRKGLSDHLVLRILHRPKLSIHHIIVPATWLRVKSNDNVTGA